MTRLLPCLLLASSLAACGGIGAAQSSACGGASGTVTPLLQGAPHGILENLVVGGGQLYFNGTSTPALLRVPVTGGAPETVVPNTDGEFAVGGGTVAWTPVTYVHHGNGVTTVESLGGVKIRDARGTVSLGLPAGTTTITRALADTNGDVYYEASDAKGTSWVIMRWSAATRAVSEVSRQATLGWLDRGQIFWMDGKAFYALDGAGAAPRELAKVPAGGVSSFLGVDSANLYYWLPSGQPGNLEGTGSLRVGGVPRAGGAPFVAFESKAAYQITSESVGIDDNGLYFIGTGGVTSTTSTIYRAKLVHGSTEEVLAQLSSVSQGLALDACAVYAAESGPSGEPQIVSVAK